MHAMLESIFLDYQKEFKVLISNIILLASQS
jgi:hypothetical protein